MCKCPEGKAFCGSSTHIGGDISCGWGKLDPNGFWEFGCYECAREMEKAYNEEFKGTKHEYEQVWPYSKEYLDSMKDKNNG